MDLPTPLFLSESLREKLSYPENFLGRSHYQVVSAREASVCAEIVLDLKPRLAALDSDSGGIDATRTIKESAVEHAVQVLVCAPSEEAAEKAREAGADDVVVGEVTPRELLDRIAELLSVPLGQRKHVRALFGVSFDGKTVSDTFLGNTVNISEGGMLVEADQELGIGDRIECRFFLTGDQRPVDIEAKVVRTAPELRGQMTAYGVMFTKVSDDDMARIRHYVNTQGSE